MADRHPLGERFHEVILSQLLHVPSGLTVLLSGGVDSQAVLAGLLEAGKEPAAMSFRLPDRESRDWTLARETARRWGVPFTDLVLDPAEESLRRYCEWAVGYGLRGKAQIECFWPRKAAIDYLEDVGSPGLATGDGGDGYFGLSKKAMIHVRPGGAPAMDEFREWYFGRPDWSQTATIRRYAKDVNPVALMHVVMPLADERLLEACRGWDWDGLNRPRQKAPIRDAFPGKLDRLPIHTNLQLGDSGIAEAFKVLNLPGGRSPVGYYNLLAKMDDPTVRPVPRGEGETLF
jgi:hypothetical protein